MKPTHRGTSRADMMIAFVRGPSVLDVGCTGHRVEAGEPQWVHGRLREQFPTAMGIDISAENIEKMRSLGFDNLLVADAQSFSLDQRFDTITAGELIEHLENPGAFLRTAAAHLAPGGRIVLTTPTPFGLMNLAYAFYKFPKTCSNGEHVSWFCPTTLHQLASRVGLDVLEWTLIEDYRADGPTRRYRMFYRMLRAMGRALPARLRCNAMLFVLAPRR